MSKFTHSIVRVAHVFCAVAILAAIPLRGEEWTPTRAFRTFNKTTYRELPQSSIVALAQDTSGMLWLGTLDGAASFDGRNITPVPRVAGAPARGVIAAIVARRNGGVAIGSPAGVHAYERGTWRLIASKKAVAAMAEATDGTLWMADTDGALWTLGAQYTWQRHAEVGAPVFALAAAHDGSIIAATEHNAVRVSNGRTQTIAGAPLPSRPGAMIVAHDGRIWVATLGGTVHWTSGSDGWHQAAFAPWPRNAFRSLAEDRRGRIFAGALGGGVAFGNAESPWTVWTSQNGPFAAGVMSIFPDDEGHIWFGMNALGLVQWLGEEWSHRPVVDPANSASPTYGGFGIAHGADSRSLLVAAFEKGFLQLTPTTWRQFTAADGLTEDVRAVVEPSRGFFIAGTRFGIFEAKPGEKFRQVLKLAGGFVTGLFHAPDGRWFAASTQGVFIRGGEQWQPAAAINAQLEDANVRNIAWSRSGELWVATLRGITVFRGDASERITSKRDPAIPDSVNAICFANDEVWIGGTGGVAVRRNGKWMRMTEADGVPGATVYSLRRAPDGSIWAGGSAGVGRFANGAWKTWDSREGLLNEESSLNGLLIDGDGVVWVGSLGGLARFDPGVKPLPVPPLKLLWRTASVDRRTLRLRWIAPWLGSHAVQYRTRIPRLHDDWSAPASEDHLDVENLGAGDWRAEVEARVEGTRDWTPPLAVDLYVPPFWYETALARIAMAALLLALIFLAIRLRVAALRRHAAELEAVVRQRTAELAEKVEQLRESEQRALAASRAKSAFLANMSHELRTPLNGVLGFAQLLSRRKQRDAEDREGLSVIMKSGEHLLNLINDVLSLSKIEAGRVTLVREPFELETLVRDVENVLRIRAEEKGLRLSFTIEGAPSRAVVGDEGKLRQILINLAGNAVKFTERGEVHLHAAWEHGRATFTVRDTGPGIAADDLSRLFEPFVQTESAQRTKEGTGLGLALSRDLARLMDGDISVSSAAGNGSTFRVEVALPEAAEDALVSAKDRRRVASLAPGQPPVRVLVVDDTALNRTVLSRLLGSVGFEVQTAESGEQAVALWESWQPHFIWMDKRMKGVDGLEATRRIRAREATTGRKRIPIIALSASALEHERGEILASGCDDFVAKPFREALIFAKLREHLGVEYVYESERSGTDVRATPRSSDGERAEAVANRGTVLLVDDDWICREVAQELLRGCGVEVATASSGAEALSIVGKSRVDLVFMDLHMPGMDGVETTRRIRAIAGKERLPIIAMSAETAEEASIGMDDAIAKPVEPEALAAALSRWLPLHG